MKVKGKIETSFFLFYFTKYSLLEILTKLVERQERSVAVQREEGLLE
jgi:hypothetical protein